MSILGRKVSPTLVAGLAADLKAAGRTLLDALDDLARAHNLYLSSQLAGRFEDPAGTVAAMGRSSQSSPSIWNGHVGPARTMPMIPESPPKMSGMIPQPETAVSTSHRSDWE